MIRQSHSCTSAGETGCGRVGAATARATTAASSRAVERRLGLYNRTNQTTKKQAFLETKVLTGRVLSIKRFLWHHLDYLRLCRILEIISQSGYGQKMLFQSNSRIWGNSAQLWLI